MTNISLSLSSDHFALLMSMMADYVELYPQINLAANIYELIRDAWYAGEDHVAKIQELEEAVFHLRGTIRRQNVSTSE